MARSHPRGSLSKTCHRGADFVPCPSRALIGRAFYRALLACLFSGPKQTPLISDSLGRADVGSEAFSGWYPCASSRASRNCGCSQVSLSALMLRLSADNLKATIYGPRGGGNDGLRDPKGFIEYGDVFQACRELARSGYRYEERSGVFCRHDGRGVGRTSLESFLRLVVSGRGRSRGRLRHSMTMETKGNCKYLFMRYRALHRVEDHMVKVGGIFHTAQNYARLV